MSKRCSVTDTDLETLRDYIIQYHIFPNWKDPHATPIRYEELQKLAKVWKLGAQRGFFRKNNDKYLLGQAILEHINVEWSFDS